MIRVRYRVGRATVVALAAAGVAVLAFAVPAAAALADIGVSPSQATQGDSAQLTFRIPNERPPAYTTKVELYLPPSAPVAEVYPMSVPDWAPGLTTRQLDKPTAELMHGFQTTEVVSLVTWTWAADPGTDPGDFQELTISLGPMPRTNRFTFSLVQTYSDGTVVRWGTDADSDASQPAGPADQPAGPGPTITLVAPAAGAGAAGGHQGGSDASATHDESSTSSPFGTGLGLAVSIAMVIVLITAGVIVMYPRRRSHPVNDAPEPKPSGQSKPSGRPKPSGQPNPSGQSKTVQEATVAEPTHR